MKHHMKVVRNLPEFNDPDLEELLLRHRKKSLMWACSTCGWKWSMGRKQFWQNQALNLVPASAFPRCKGTPLRQHYMDGGSL